MKMEFLSRFDKAQYVNAKLEKTSAKNFFFQRTPRANAGKKEGSETAR